MILNYTVIRDRDAAALLTSVLERKKSVVAGIGGIDGAVAEYSENAAFLMQPFLCITVERIIQNFTVR